VARKIHRLKALQVARTNEPGLLADGGGLYLQVSDAGAKSWLFRFMLAGRARAMGLGSLHTISLAEARNEAARCRKLLREKIDPIEARNGSRGQAALEAAKAITFEQCAQAYVQAHRLGWKNAKHVQQWQNTLSTYAYPVFGSLPVAGVDTALVMRCLEPIWKHKAETASRVRGRIESVLDWATVRGYRAGENPARWRGHLAKLLPIRAKVQRVEHHAALPYAEMPGFVAELRRQTGVAARALEFTILTATRTSEVLGAQWGEINLDARVWTIPASRMKAGIEHRVPLCGRAIALLQELGPSSRGYVFPGQRPRQPLSNMAMLMLLKRMEYKDLTVHGFRSSFRDWAAEKTNTPRELCEMALAHTIGDKAEAAYRRGDLFDRRRALMAQWQRHCETLKRKATLPTVTGGRGCTSL
jgi:integrase